MPTLNILNTHILYSSSNPADGDTGSPDPAPVGPSYPPGLQQIINSFGQMGQPQNPPSPSAPLTTTSDVAQFSLVGDAPALEPANLTAGLFAAFAGADSQPPSDTGSSDPAPVGPGYDPGLQQLINSFGQMGQPQNTPSPSAPLTMPSEVAHFSPLEEVPALGPASLAAGSFAAFAGADSPVPPPDAGSSDPAPVGPGYDPGLQQLINSFGQMSQPTPTTPPETFRPSAYLSWHHVRLDP